MSLEIEINNKNNSIDAEITHRQLELGADIGESELYVEKDYNDLINKPSINNVTLEGNKTSDNLNLQSKITEENKLDYNLIENAPKNTSDLNNNGEDGSSPYATQKWVLDNEIEGKIDVITKNGEELPIIDKTVNIEVPTKNSELENDSNFATEEYVNKYGGKIDSIELNGETLPIENKNVNIEIDKTDVGLSNVDNTSDIDKPISTKQQEAITKVQLNIDSEVTNRIEADKNLQSNLTAHEQNTNNPHKVTKSQVGLSEVDNTSDKNKPVSTPTQSALDLKLDKENANLSITKDINVDVDGDNVYLDLNYRNLNTKTETSNKKQIKLASDSEAGLMSIADYAQIRKNTEDIGQLKDQNIRLLYTTSENPTSEDIKNFVISEGYTDESKWVSIAVVVQNTNHIWRYYDNTQIWQDIGVDTVNTFTNDIAGIIKGSSVDGKIYAETDGTGSVNGWATLKSDLSNEISNRESADKTLQTNIDNEIAVRKSEDSKLQTNIDNEIATRQEADEKLQNSIDNLNSSLSEEISNRTNNDSILQTNIDEEASTRASEDTKLQTNITTINSNLSSEITNRENADKELQSQIDTNKTNIDTNKTNIENEIKNRTSSDTALQTNINTVSDSLSSEITNRTKADEVLQTNITTEIANRQSADNTLQSNIDALDGQVVKLGTDQTIPSIKTFSNYIKTPQVASVEGKRLVRYKEAEGKSVYGNDSTGNVLMGNTDRPSYSKSGSDFTGTDLALYSDVTAETSARTLADGQLSDKIDTEITNRTNADTTLQGNIDSEASTREANDTTLQTNIDKEATARQNSDASLQSQIGTNSSSISDLQSTKLNSSNANKNVVSGVTVSANDDNVNVVRAYVNLSTQATSSDAETFPLANDTTAGLMSKADYAQIRSNTSRIEQLEGQNIRLTYTASTSPTASQIEAFVKAEGYTDTSKWIYIGVVVSGTNHIWRYYSNTTTWTDIGVDTVNQFTNSIAGIIKGSATAGKVYAETDGTGSVYGWDNLNTSVSNNTTAISDETTNRTNADSALQTNIDNEKTARESADTNLQSQITTNAENIATNTTNISSKMDKENPTGTGSFSLNRKAGTTIGTNSFAEGFKTTASGSYSHSEGSYTTSSSSSSHAEGYSTTASSSASHAEGYSTKSSGFASHSEGNSTTASAPSSHSEGAETTASGLYAHSEGYNTIAQRQSQHTFGEYNIADTQGDTSSRGEYVEIVGNGTAASRSNARTLDWSGNETLAGNLQASGLTDGTTTKTMTEMVGLVDKVAANTTNIANKLEASNIKAGTNITVSTSGNDVTISAETGEGGTNVYVNSVKQDSINFTSDPQTQIDNTVKTSGDQSIAGTKNFTGKIKGSSAYFPNGFGALGTEAIPSFTFSDAVNVGMELGRRDGTAGTPYIDFHTDGSSSTDFNARMLASGNALNITATGGLLVNGTNVGVNSYSNDTSNRKGYIRYANGLQICWGNWTFGNTSNSKTTQTFPVAFSTTNTMCVLATAMSSNKNGIAGGVTSITTTNVSINFYGVASSDRLSGMQWVAIGFWK